MATAPTSLNLLELGEAPGLPALTTAQGQCFANAAAVCLQDHNKHAQGVSLGIDGVQTNTYNLYWPDPTEQVRRTHNDEGYATEHGACAIAIMLALRLTGYTVIDQARKGGGFDYWLGTPNQVPFEAGTCRLEVSGILHGNSAKLNSRTKQKKKQTNKSAHLKLTAYACVVEFTRPFARFEKVV